MGYGLIGLLRGNPFFTISCYSIFALIELGLQEIAAAMSDPFGDDEIDFDTQVPLRRRYSAKAAHAGVVTAPLQCDRLSHEGAATVPLHRA